VIQQPVTQQQDEVGRRFVRALAAKDTTTLLAVLAPDVALRGMTPGRFWEASGPDQAVHEVLYRWFEPSDVVEEVLWVETGSAHDRPRVDYRFRVRNPDGVHLVEQRAYYELDDEGRVARADLTCAGFRRL
jgi:ketosteroid isomerase-like protein